MNLCSIPACELLLAIYVVGWLGFGALFLRLRSKNTSAATNIFWAYLIAAAWPVAAIINFYIVLTADEEL